MSVQSQYRPEIDGLRSIAVIAVIFFHMGIPGFSGGFVGVDIFFVISGYLITKKISEQLREKTFTYRGFYEKRMRRLLPALLLIILFTLPVAWVYLLPEELVSYAKSIIFTLLFLPNLFFYKESGYFDQAAEFKPLLHTWSLGVEEQFYIFFPIVLIGLLRLNDVFRFGVIILIAISSLYFAHVSSSQYAVFGFYMLHTRVWEFLLGSIAAHILIHQEHQLSRFFIQLPKLLGAIGLLLIGGSIYFLSSEYPYPSFYTLVPAIGAVLVILFGGYAGVLHRLLTLKIFVLTGLISYSLYLWHQPIIVFYKLIYAQQLNFIDWVILFTITFGASYLSWKFIEKPYRDISVMTPNIFYKRLIFFIGVLICAAAIIKLNNGFHQRYNLSPGLQGFFEGKVWRGCDPNQETKPCIVGDISRQNVDIVILGDSHSGAILPAFDKLGKDNNLKIARLGVGGCPPLFDAYVIKGHENKSSCATFAIEQLNYVFKTKPSYVVLAARWQVYGNDLLLARGDSLSLSLPHSRQVFRESLMKTVDLYKSYGFRVHILSEVPEQINSPKEVYYKISKFSDEVIKKYWLAKYSVDITEHHDSQRIAREILLHSGAHVIELDDFFCDNIKCYMGNNKLPFYYDKHHISSEAAEMLSQKIFLSLK